MTFYDHVHAQHVARLFTNRAELLTTENWQRRPLSGADALNRVSLGVSDHLAALGVEFTVAIKVSEKAGKRQAWFELTVPAADVDRAIGWPARLFG